MRVGVLAGIAVIAALVTGCSEVRPPATALQAGSAVASARVSPGAGVVGPVFDVEGADASAAVRSAVADFRSFAERESLGGGVEVSYVLSTSAVAELQLYGDVPGQGGSAPVVVMAACGLFSTGWEKVPPGFRPQPVRCLTRIAPLQYGAAQYSGGGTDAAPDLAVLGPVVLAG